MRMLMDEVSFVKGGSVVRMRKKSNAGALPRGESGMMSKFAPLGVAAAMRSDAWFQSRVREFGGPS